MPLKPKTWIEILKPAKDQLCPDKGLSSNCRESNILGNKLFRCIETINILIDQQNAGVHGVELTSPVTSEIM